MTAFFLVVIVSATQLPAQSIALSPPLGWNSWDAYGLTINETDFRANATVLDGLREFGWEYAVIDEGWYMQNPFGGKVDAQKDLWDGNGILIPVVRLFPSSANGAGFKPLADWLHAKGLKFGIHIVRGIPREVVKENLPIANSSFRAADAADMTSPCPWNEENWGVADNAAGQAYYDSMLRKYASWGLDYIKVDCISDHPYRITEIKQIASAIRKTGRPIVLSLSPGPTQLEHAAEVAQYAQMWRIADDHWDGWSFEHKPGAGEFPIGTRDAFDRLAKWVPYVGPGSWPDEDMLPFGWLGPASGLGRGAPVKVHAGRRADRVHALVHDALTADSGRESHQTRCLHALAHHQPDAALHRSVFVVQPAGRCREPARRFSKRACLAGHHRHARRARLCGIFCLLQPRQQSRHTARHMERPWSGR